MYRLVSLFLQSDGNKKYQSKIIKTRSTLLFKTTLMVKMDLFFFFKSSTTEQKPEALSSPPPKKTKKDYDKKYYLSKRTRTFQETWLTDFQ